MFSRFQAFHFGLNIGPKSDPEKECVLGWVFDDFGSILGAVWDLKSIKKACGNHMKFGRRFGMAFGGFCFTSGQAEG